MEAPLISVIMGVYNAKPKLLSEAIRSILAQTHQNFEFIICDDGSTNGTSEWLAEFAKKDKRIRLLTNPENMHLAATLNRCIRAARGTYLARQDADDISDPTRLEKQLAFLEANPNIDFVGSNCSEYNTKDGIFSQRHMPEFPSKRDFLFNSPFIHGSLMFRSSCLNKDSCYAVTKWTTRTEDYDMFMRLYSCGKKGANLQENLYNYHYGHAQRHIAMHYRVDEMVLRYRGFRSMGLLPEGLPYVVKPILLGILPDHFVSSMRDKKNQLAIA